MDYEKRILDTSPHEFLPFSMPIPNAFSLDNVTLNIAVTGYAGSGKSSLVNAIRGVGNGEPGYNTDVTETTMNPTMYPHPTMPNVKLWDLPGIGTPTFRANDYLQIVEFDRYDFFMIVSSVRFVENDLMLATEIQRRKKLFYFVRSKIDLDVQAEQRRPNANVPKRLDDIRRECESNLRNIRRPKVFLMSSFELEHYDFQELIQTLENDLPEHKRNALLLSLPVYSSEILRRKVAMFQNLAWAASTASAAAAVVPVPDHITISENAEVLRRAQTAAATQEVRTCLDNVTLNIAVTGKPGAGKSSLVNAMRGVNGGELGAAETGITETINMYPHPTMPNVRLWDLPGIGSINFETECYLKKVQFDGYDFFIIVSSERFGENDLMLATEIQKRKKSFYFVRSKIDNDVQAEKRKCKFSLEEMLGKIRADCENNFKKIENPKVFLVSLSELDKYDFQELTETPPDFIYRRGQLQVQIPLRHVLSQGKDTNNITGPLLELR
ncbi:hypothetical protein JZ751_007449 [Albula glossodonta]|uniref:IRG-type G domain-containing protein n=1 Tax=Albula glossodonta TaxID=121402 RepID=A0A8T2N3X3_9TELE|nr:hypothetical protein JZ751_007449 [Albula glossodonta]